MINIIYILGKPCSGKGSIANILCTKFKFHYIEASKFLFQFLSRKYGPDSFEITNVKNGKKIFHYPVLGHLILSEIYYADKTCIIDGYPRVIAQLEHHIQLLKTDDFLEKANKIIIQLNIDDHAIINRSLNRRICLNCNISYGIQYLYSECNICKQLLTKRKDDTINIIKDRLDSYKQTESIIDRMKELATHYIEIDANNDLNFIINSIYESKIKNIFI